MSATKIIKFTNNDDPPVVHLAQGTNAIPLVFQLADWTPPTGSSARIYVKKPSGMEVYNACSIEGAIVTAEITTQMTAEPGWAECQINISTPAGTVGNSFVFWLVVEETIIDGSAVQSTNEYTVLQGLINDAQESISEAWDAASEAYSATSYYFVKATYSYSSGVHTLTLPTAQSSANTIYFIPTVAWSAGDTLRIKRGTASATGIGAKTTSGADLPAGAWAANSAVLCVINAGNAYFPLTKEPDAVVSRSTTVNLGGSSVVNLERYGNVVTGFFTLPGPWGAGVTTLSGQIPSGFRPKNNFRSAFYRAYSGNTLSNNGMQLLVGTSGDVQMIATDSMANTWTYRATVTWQTADD